MIFAPFFNTLQAKGYLKVLLPHPSGGIAQRLMKVIFGNPEASNEVPRDEAPTHTSLEDSTPTNLRIL